MNTSPGGQVLQWGSSVGLQAYVCSKNTPVEFFVNVCLLSEHKPLKKCEHCLKVHPHGLHEEVIKWWERKPKHPGNSSGM